MIVVCCIMHNVAKHLQDPDDFPDYMALLGNIGNPDVDDVRIRQRGQERRHQLATIIQMTIQYFMFASLFSCVNPSFINLYNK